MTMKKLLLSTITSTVLLIPTLAAADEMADKYFSAHDNPTLTAQEKKSLSIVKKWHAGSGSAQPFAGRGGSVTFAFGVEEPGVVCAVLQVCDIALQPGEQVNSIQLGDTARWSVEPAISGTGTAEIQHLLIKPMDVGLKTSLVITTDRRTYHIRLLSHRTDYMPQTTFSYPEEALAKWEKQQAYKKKQRDDATISTTSEYLGDLDFSYNISGYAPWKPLRVYTDGHKTIIQMPKTMSQTEAPSLLVLRRGSGFFNKIDEVMVNYRIQGDRYIVDRVFDKAILISGVGKSQNKITITYRKK